METVNVLANKTCRIAKFSEMVIHLINLSAVPEVACRSSHMPQKKLSTLQTKGKNCNQTLNDHFKCT